MDANGALALQEPNGHRYAVLWRNAKQHMDVVWHRIALYQLCNRSRVDSSIHLRINAKSTAKTGTVPSERVFERDGTVPVFAAPTQDAPILLLFHPVNGYAQLYQQSVYGVLEGLDPESPDKKKRKRGTVPSERARRDCPPFSRSPIACLTSKAAAHTA